MKFLIFRRKVTDTVGNPMIEYKFPCEVEYDFIPEVLQIDAGVYDAKLQGTYESVSTRFKANKDSYVLAFNNSKLIGYICFFPISADFNHKLEEGQTVFDDNIKPDDIVGYDEHIGHTIFLISAVTKPEFQGKGIGSELMRRLFSFLSGKTQDGYAIKSIFSFAYTAGGEALCRKFGFEEIKTFTSGPKLMRYMF